MVPKIRSPFPRPRGTPTVLCTRSIRFSTQTCTMCSLTKSVPWSQYNTDGSPHTGHRGSVFRQIACRNANAVPIAVGSPRNTVYPATTRE